MTTVRSSAPGKAVICGEYAVLKGATALSMALDRRAVVTLAQTGATHHVLAVPGYAEGAFRFRALPGGDCEWLDTPPAPSAFALFEAVWQRAATQNHAGLSITLDTRAFVEPGSGQKLGIGSSAALAVALVAGLDQLRVAASSAQAMSIEQLQATALEAHTHFQAGRGSGIDIATAVHGGLLAYRRGMPGQAASWPPDLRLRFLWSGRSADTVSRIGGLRDATQSKADKALDQAANDAFHCLAGGDGEVFLARMRRFVSTLLEFDAARGLDIFAAGHRALVDRALQTGDVVYKPCGAGGGDIGVAMSTSPTALDTFCGAAEASGFRRLNARLEPRGVLVEAS